MINIQITVNTANTPQNLVAIKNLLSGLSCNTSATPENEDFNQTSFPFVAEEKSAISVSDIRADVESVAKVKKGRGPNKVKDLATPLAQQSTQPAEVATQQVTASVTPPVGQNATVVVKTRDDLMSELNKFVEAHGMDRGRQALAGLGYVKMSTIPDDKIGYVIEGLHDFAKTMNQPQVAASLL